jgi:glutamate-1-semialdehyde 2,1-aminomutase
VIQFKAGLNEQSVQYPSDEKVSNTMRNNLGLAIERRSEFDGRRARAHEIIPGGCHTYAKGDDQYPVNAPPFLARGEGCRVWDMDGNEYIEYGSGNRAVGLGHAYPAVVKAVEAALMQGCNFTRPAPIELECAERFLEMIDGAEMVKFCKNGSDATSGAVRLARAYTGRNLIARCADHPFFSVDDWFIGTTPMSAGIPKATRDMTLAFRYNDLESVKALFDRHPDQIAALILEPERTDPPHAGFLKGLQALCHDRGALLIFDEMITGFRWDNGGAQRVHGVVPDLSTWGKALANGFSVSALAGKREFMRLGGLDHYDKPRVFLLSTTHGAETHALAAAIATMMVYSSEPVIQHLKQMGARLKHLLDQVIVRHGLTSFVQIVGHPACLLYATFDQEKKPSQSFRTLLLQETIRRGILMPSLAMSYSHRHDDIEATVEAVDAALAVYRDALENGVERYLYGRPSEPVYRAYNLPPLAPSSR